MASVPNKPLAKDLKPTTELAKKLLEKRIYRTMTIESLNKFPT